MLGPKKKVGELEIGKRIMVKDHHQRYSSIQKSQLKYKSKLPAITTKSIVIKGDLKISEMLSNPTE
jgi:hypothetical protein